MFRLYAKFQDSMMPGTGQKVCVGCGGWGGWGGWGGGGGGGGGDGCKPILVFSFD